MNQYCEWEPMPKDLQTLPKTFLATAKPRYGKRRVMLVDRQFGKLYENNSGCRIDPESIRITHWQPAPDPATE